MNRVALWTCALLAVTDARIYDRCELARTLQDLGTAHEHISTWVCIAYHESRLDTAAYNSNSGDHGIFQISQLYWCGGGKACGLSCDVLRDDNIADDLQCALQVHEEHTRLQGNGFLAWVVYPQHCNGNTKKYLAGCDLRGGRTTAESYPFTGIGSFQNTDINNNVNPNIDNLLPPYLAINSIFRSRYGKQLDHKKTENVDWFNYKFDKIDELKLPVAYSKVNAVDEIKPLGVVTVGNKVEPVYYTTTTKTTSTTTSVPPVVPRRYIDTDQFRKKTTDTTTSVPSIAFERYTTQPSRNAIGTKSTMYYSNFTFGKPQTTSSTYSRPTQSTTHKSVTYATQDISPKVKSTAALYNSQTSIKPASKTNTAYKLPAFATSYRTTTSPTVSNTITYTFTTPSWRRRFTTPTPKQSKSTTIPFFRTTKTSTTTVRPRSSAPVKPTVRSTTPWYTFTSRNTLSQATRPTTTTAKYPQLYTSRSIFWSTTQRPTSTQKAWTERTSRSTQSIWDLYLNPTKPPKFVPFNFSRGNNKYKLNIFSDGTTTIGPLSVNYH